MDADVLVAGAGAAGLAAALAAGERGRSVIVLDARQNFRQDSNTSMSTAMIPAGGSRWQQALGIDDDRELFYADIIRKTKGAAYEPVARALTRTAPTLVEWLADRHGLPLSLATDVDYPGHSRRRCHTVPERSGQALHGHLLRAIAALPSVTLAVPMTLQAVEVPGAGPIRAIVSEPGGSPDTIEVGAVVLATGGFGGNQELVRRHLPSIADAWYFGSAGNNGSAIAIGENVGADLGYLDAYQGHGSVATPTGIMVTWTAIMHGGLILNGEGRRFDDETQGYSEYAEKVLAQPTGVCWLVLDERIDQLCRPFADYARLVESGAIHWAADRDEVASRIGVSVAAVDRTLSDADAAARSQVPDAFGRRTWEQPLAAPYGLVRITGALFHTQGGLLVDEQARVLEHGRPMRGLFAAGGAAAGMSGHGAAGYLAGNGLLAALGLGFLAGSTTTSVG